MIMFVHSVQTDGEQLFFGRERLGVTEKIEFDHGVVRGSPDNK